MANKVYTTMSEESIRYLCGLINKIVSLPTDVISNINLADNLTFSNIHIKNLIDQCLQDANAEAEKLVGALTHLTCKETTVQPTLDNSEINVIYLYSADGNAPYQQYLKISDTKLIDLGSTSVSLTDYLTITSAASTYAKQTDLKTLSDEVSGIKTKIGTGSLDTTSDTLTGAINEVKGIAEQGALLTVTKTQYDQLVAGQTVNIDGKDYTYDSNTYYVVKDDNDSITVTSTIDLSSTDSEVPTAKAVRLNIIGNKPSDEIVANAGNSVLKFPLGNWQVYSSDFAKSLSDLPVQTGGRLEVLCNGVGATTPWTDTYTPRMYKYYSYSKGEYERYLYSSATPGVMAYDSGWRRVCTTKVADVQQTAITYEDTTNYELENPALNYYEVIDGICYVSLYARCKNPYNGYDSFINRTLPKPKRAEYKTAGAWDTTNSVLKCCVNIGGNLLFRGGTANGVYLETFSYPVAES